ncbi:MAG TPA: hypothetical protein DDW72_23725 [Afipia sp.]|nr:hypothetical protein [Afipia sp.]
MGGAPEGGGGRGGGFGGGGGRGGVFFGGGGGPGGGPPPPLPLFQLQSYSSHLLEGLVQQSIEHMGVRLGILYRSLQSVHN